MTRDNTCGYSPSSGVSIVRGPVRGTSKLQVGALVSITGEGSARVTNRTFAIVLIHISSES